MQHFAPRVRASKGIWCRRKKFHKFSLDGLAKKLAPGMRVHVSWSDGAQKATWIGRVEHKETTKTAQIAYVGQNVGHLWPFPPADPSITIDKVSLPAPPFKGLTVSSLRSRMRLANVGSFVRLRFSKGDAVHTWTGVVSWMGRGVCRVLWFPLGYALPFPPPKAASTTVLYVRFSPPTSRIEGGHASAVLRRKRFLDLLSACENAIGSCAPPAHDKQEEVTPDLLPTKIRKKKSNLTFSTLNPRTLTDDARAEALELVDEDQTVLEAFISHGKYRQPPLIWVPPRPILPRGCVRFEWHHFRNLLKPPLPAAHPKEQGQETRRRKQKGRQGPKERKEHALSNPEDPAHVPRILMTRSGRVATVLPAFYFAEEGEETPAQSET